jgi:hypothetical protein
MLQSHLMQLVYKASSVLKKDGIHSQAWGLHGRVGEGTAGQYSPELEKIEAASTTLAHEAIEGHNDIVSSGMDDGGVQEGVAATAAESNLEIIDDGVQSIMQRQVRHSARVILL